MRSSFCPFGKDFITIMELLFFVETYLPFYLIPYFIYFHLFMLLQVFVFWHHLHIFYRLPIAFFVYLDIFASNIAKHICYHCRFAFLNVNFSVPSEFAMIICIVIMILKNFPHSYQIRGDFIFQISDFLFILFSQHFWFRQSFIGLKAHFAMDAG